ncbi:MAG: 1-acyl-sn-glycerol-3-phosphate acyltransferase [Clostridiales bacterium]|jgi:1-acyl-sn-glycerol-3-phosphate acyltransferase|nr:1-acyl-sn-glycerol-3-phosphate acyltransferase [Clostridiales bacterium]
MKKVSYRKAKKWRLAFVRAAANLAAGIVKFAFGNKIIKKTQVDYSQNYLILCTHGSGLDILHAMAALKGLDFTVVAARKLFYSKLGGPLLRMFDAIPKKQYAVDLAAMRMIKNAAERGESVFLCPEGRSTPDGVNGYISPAVSKLIKWLGLPVIFVNPKGSYLSYPRWRRIPRFGRMTTDVELMLTKREAREFSNDAIYERVTKFFTFNDYDYQINERLKFFTLSPAKEIQRLLFVCPSCKSLTDMTSTNKTVFCKACDCTATVNLDATLDFRGEKYFSRIDEWIAFQKKEIAKIVAEPGFSYSVDAKLLFENDENNSYKKIADGAFGISRAGVSFKVSAFADSAAENEYGEKYSEIFYPAKNLTGLSYDKAGLELYAYESTQKYKFTSDVVIYRINLMIESVFRLSKI